MKKKLLGLFFALVLCALVLPTAAFAEDVTPNYLTFTAKEAGSTVTFNYSSAAKDSNETSLVTSVDIGKDAVFYKKNNDAWQYYSKGTQITLNENETVSFAGTNVTTDNYNHFSMTTGSIAASGDVTSLTNGSGGDATLTPSCYYLMFFQCTALTTAPALPATKLANSCYMNMFSGCTNLTTAPALLPATELAESCYSGMFNECTSLTTAPALKATTLADSCYESMFFGCTNLKNLKSEGESAPTLPATTLKYHCYYCMFYNCTSLTTAPTLPAITLADFCYAGMFYGCTSLATAPALPATTLADSCYQQMFYSCTKLATAPALPATTLKNSCYYKMFYGCNELTAPADLSDVETLADGCCKMMYAFCTKLKVYESETVVDGDDFKKAWKATSASEVSNWSTNMFQSTGGDLKGENEAPTAGQTYYVQGSSEPKIVSGYGASYQIGSSEGLTFKSDADIGFFTCVKVDGTEIAEENYEIKKGSTIVTLKPAYLDTLSVGEHKIEIVSTTGTVDAKFTITAAANTNPNTGLTEYDSGILLALLACAGAVLLMAVRKRIRG